ncbi:head completion/stabilization protein [Stenotrophomonas sp. Iso1]|uniref:head completion/stabilization protein n=1 Tax=Stenotrophomonas sp. Iso1 TaxID=2977283 RepID=UPI0022B79498|nr:head completion/stabilization protein [Stenotrophomonas sp. Iso1]
MSGLVANASPAKQEPDVTSGAFWPAIVMPSLRAAVRLTGDVTNERLRAAVVGAVIAVNDELATWSEAQQDKGHATMDAIPSPLIDGNSRLVQLYLRAVYCATTVELHERFRSYDATAQGNQRADDLTPTIDEMRRDLRYAISDVLGTRRVTVELI